MIEEQIEYQNLFLFFWVGPAFPLMLQCRIWSVNICLLMCLHKTSPETKASVDSIYLYLRRDAHSYHFTCNALWVDYSLYKRFVLLCKHKQQCKLSVGWEYYTTWLSGMLDSYWATYHPGNWNRCALLYRTRAPYACSLVSCKRNWRHLVPGWVILVRITIGFSIVISRWNNVKMFVLLMGRYS